MDVYVKYGTETIKPAKRILRTANPVKVATALSKTHPAAVLIAHGLTAHDERVEVRMTLSPKDIETVIEELTLFRKICPERFDSGKT